jgi:hypothetical protein
MKAKKIKGAKEYKKQQVILVAKDGSLNSKFIFLNHLRRCVLFK